MKVLLITHNPTSTDNNMGKTFLTLFSEFEKDELCQLYVHPTVPDVDLCHSYFRITDKQVVKSFLRFSHPGGQVPADDVAERIANRNDGVSVSPPPRAKTSPIRRIIRDTVWKLSRWYSPSLKAWLDSERPTCIFLAPGYACFIYDIALRISEEYGIPIVTYICDDYYFVNQPKNPVDRLHLSFLKRKTESLMSKTSHLVAISQPIREEYSEKFFVKATVIMTGASGFKKNDGNVTKTVRSAAYFGNIGCNRHVSLADIGRTLDEINDERGTDYTLDIYTSEPSQAVKDCFKQIKSVSFKGFVTGDAFAAAYSDADMLIHTEAFDAESIDLVKNSVSTKIADALASGKVFFAYGPDTIASMRHLADNDCAVIANDKNQLKQMLYTAFTDEELRKNKVDNALATAKKYHDLKTNSLILKNILEQC